MLALAAPAGAHGLLDRAEPRPGSRVRTLAHSRERLVHGAAGARLQPRAGAERQGRTGGRRRQPGGGRGRAAAARVGAPAGRRHVQGPLACALRGWSSHRGRVHVPGDANDPRHLLRRRQHADPHGLRGDRRGAGRTRGPYDRIATSSAPSGAPGCGSTPSFTAGTSTESPDTGERYLRYLLDELGVRDAATVAALSAWRRGYNAPHRSLDGRGAGRRGGAARWRGRAACGTACISNSNGTVAAILERLGLGRPSRLRHRLVPGGCREARSAHLPHRARAGGDGGRPRPSTSATSTPSTCSAPAPPA